MVNVLWKKLDRNKKFMEVVNPSFKANGATVGKLMMKRIEQLAEKGIPRPTFWAEKYRAKKTINILKPDTLVGSLTVGRVQDALGADTSFFARCIRAVTGMSEEPTTVRHLTIQHAKVATLAASLPIKVGHGRFAALKMELLRDIINWPADEYMRIPAPKDIARNPREIAQLLKEVNTLFRRRRIAWEMRYSLLDGHFIVARIAHILGVEASFSSKESPKK